MDEKRARNKEASAKSRKKTKDKIASLEAENQRLREDAAQQEARITVLTEQLRVEWAKPSK